MESVMILLSTFNGERYIEEQLDSLLAQENVNLQILVRDDGSKDNTRRILCKYAALHPNIKLLLEDNCGAEESFNRLCRYAIEEYSHEYFAFCDQDDVWDKDKLSIAMDRLKDIPSQVPQLYFSNLLLVDERLTPLGMMYQTGQVNLSKYMTLMQIFTYGCTCVFNKKALELYCLCGKNLVYHDNWIFVLCQLFGEVVYDDDSHLKYRQHNSNLSEHKINGYAKFKKRISQLRDGKFGHKFEIIANQLLHSYEAYLSDQDLKNLLYLISTYRSNISSKIRLLFNRDYKTGNLSKDISNRLRILINHL